MPQQHAWGTIPLVLGVLLITKPVIAADPVPTDDLTCFCLRQPSGTVLKGCRARLASPNDAMPRATCWDEAKDQNRPAFTIDSSWTMIRAGEDRCTPCDLRLHQDAPDAPRGTPPLPGNPTTLPPGPPRPISPPGQVR